MEKYGFVYIWRDSKHKRYYIGCHWGTISDGYICSSSWMKKVHKYRPDDFKRKILQTNISRELLLDEEYNWLSQIKPEELGKRYYNLKQHKWGHWSNDPEKRLTIGQKISKINRGMPGPNLGRKMSEETKQKLRIANLGKKASEETKRKISESGLGRPAWNKGKKMSEEFKQKIVVSHAGKILKEKIPIKGKNRKSFAIIDKLRKNDAKCKPIITPFGKFQSVRDAARNLRVERKSIEYRLKSNSGNFDDWNYING